MFIDARELPTAETLACDVCIIGGGAAGVTLALELRQSGLDVILLESGGMGWDEKTQSLYEGPLIDRTYSRLDEARLRFMGGSTNHWSGNCMEFEPHDFEVRDDVPHTGWPITLDDLKPFYRRAYSYVEISDDTPFDFETWRPKLTPSPLDFDPKTFKHVIFRHSPPTAFGHWYEQALAAAGDLRVVLYANALELETSDNAKTVTSASCGVIDGPRFSVEAKRFVLSMGGIETPRLLLLSNKVQTPGLGNDADLVGRFFMDHPALRPVMHSFLRDATDDFALYTDDHETPKDLMSVMLAGQPEMLKTRGVLGFRFHLLRSAFSPGEGALRHIVRSVRRGETPYRTGHHLAEIATDLDGVANALYHSLIDRHSDLIEREWLGPWISIECAPNPDSRVMLVDEREPHFGQRRIGLDWRFAELDMRTVNVAVELLAREFGRLGYRHTWSGYFSSEATWPRFTAHGKHHCGTTRMSDDPKTGVVDKDCKVHGTSNLFVSSSSVFPTHSYATPTLTIVAMAIRLADKLKADFAAAPL